MADEHGLLTQVVGSGADIVEIVGDGTRAERLGQCVAAVASPTHRNGTKTFVGEEVQEMLIPTLIRARASTARPVRRGVYRAAW